MAGVALATLGLSSTLGQPRALTAAEVKQALAWGEAANPSPYLLHSLDPRGRQNSIVVGAVYTPFLRVALAAAAARVRGSQLQVDGLQPELLEPVVYVALRWFCGNARGECNPDVDEPITDALGRFHLARPGDQLALRDLRLTASPIWVEPGTGRLRDFGDLPFTDIVLVAAYALDALAHHDFVIFREYGAAREVRVGRVTTEELRRWR